MSPAIHHLERAFWALLLGAVSMGVKTLSDISISVGTLNEHMALVVERVSWHDTELKRQDIRIYNLESKGGHR